jgi:hypothetical protein
MRASGHGGKKRKTNMFGHVAPQQLVQTTRSFSHLVYTGPQIRCTFHSPPLWCSCAMRALLVLFFLVLLLMAIDEACSANCARTFDTTTGLSRHRTSCTVRKKLQKELTAARNARAAATKSRRPATTVRAKTQFILPTDTGAWVGTACGSSADSHISPPFAGAYASHPFARAHRIATSDATTSATHQGRPASQKLPPTWALRGCPSRTSCTY